MTKITDNFRAIEFDCRCGCATPAELVPVIELLALQLQVIRDNLKRPIIITSGYRCNSHNYAVGGASRSYHMHGMAADFYCQGVSTASLKATILDLIRKGQIVAGGLKAYGTFVHYDIRGVTKLF